MSIIDRNLARLDLNLVTALHALLEFQSVSLASRSVGRTQSAMSHSLSRLRDHFQDPLLVRDGWSMRPTPFAERLRPKVQDAAAAIGALFEGEAAFDPAVSTRRIKLAAPDLCATLLSSLIANAARQSPGASFEFIEGQSVRDSILRSDADIGLVFGQPKPDPNLWVHAAMSLKWCTFAPSDHAFARSASKAEWQRAAHIVVGRDDGAVGPVDAACKKQRLKRDVFCYAPNFSAALTLAVECDGLFTTLCAPFESTARKLGLTPCRPPFDIADAPAFWITRADHGNNYQLWLQGLCQNSKL